MNYYRFDITTQTGAKLSQYFDKAVSCEKAAMDLAEELGAQAYEPDNNMSEAGATLGLYFPKGTIKEAALWDRYKCDNGDVLHYPNVGNPSTDVIT